MPRPYRLVLVLAFALAAVSLSAQQEKGLGNISAGAGAFGFIQGELGDGSLLLPSLQAALQYQLLNEVSLGIGGLVLIHPAIDWHVPGVIPFPFVSFQYDHNAIFSQRLHFGPPMWAQPYVLAGYSALFLNFMGTVHAYYDWERDFFALGLSAGYQLDL